MVIFSNREKKAPKGPSACNTLANAIRLWPEPDEAPEVPPRQVLERYLKDPDATDADLSAQIRESINCRRMLERLKLEQGPHPILSKTKTLKPLEQAFFLRLANKFPVSTSSAPAKARPAGMAVDQSRASVGQIWTTRSEVCRWTNGQMRRRWTFLPQDIVIVAPPQELAWDTVFHAVAATPAELWPGDWLVDGDIRAVLADGAAHILHLWLNKTVSIYQFGQCLGVLNQDSAESLRAGTRAAAGKSAVKQRQDACARSNADALFERERLRARAEWLSATADARREWYESICELPGNTRRFLGAPEITEPLLSLAAGTRKQDRREAQLRVFSKNQRPGDRKSLKETLSAVCLLPLHWLRDGSGLCNGVWKIARNQKVFKPGTIMALCSRENIKPLASGVVACDGLTVEIRSPFLGYPKDMQSGDWFLVEIPRA